MTIEPEIPPDEMDDDELYWAYQQAKEEGPVDAIDDLQREIAERWEAELEDGYEDFQVPDPR